MIHIILSVLFDVIVYNYLSWKVVCKINIAFRDIFRELKCINIARCQLSMHYTRISCHLQDMKN